MGFRLVNQNNPNITLSMTTPTWYRILEVAEEYGWVPMGTVMPEWWLESAFARFGYGLDDPYDWQGGYTEEDERLVMLEDVARFSEALEQAYYDYEPEYIQDWREFFLADTLKAPVCTKIAIGVLEEMVLFTQMGTFSIQRI